MQYFYFQSFVKNISIFFFFFLIRFPRNLILHCNYICYTCFDDKELVSHFTLHTVYQKEKVHASNNHLYRVSNIPFFFAPIIIFASYPIIKIECGVITIIYSSFVYFTIIVNFKKLIDKKKFRSPNLNKNSRIDQI